MKKIFSLVLAFTAVMGLAFFVSALAVDDLRFDTQPAASTTVTQGNISGNLSVIATATGISESDIEYQWYENTVNSHTGGTKIDGATTAVFTIPYDLMSNKYYYYCVASATSFTPVYSSVATVTVNPPVITINTHPAANTPVVQGSISGNISVAAAVTFGSSLSFQWYSTSAINVDGEAIGGATAASYPIPTDLSIGTYYYYCIVNDSTLNAIAVRSNTATVTVNAPTYTVTVNGGTSDKDNITQGTVITVTADTAPEGKRFLNWTSNSLGVTFANAEDETTTFAMPANNVEIEADYIDLSLTTNVTFTAVQVGGTSKTANSTAIQITFSQAVTGLTVNHITVTNGTGAVVKGALSGSGAVYTIALNSVTTEGNVTVKIGNFGLFTVTTTPQTVAVYKNTNETEDNFIYGDLNRDGVVNNADLILLLRYFAQPNIAIDIAAADVNGDGVVNNADLILLLRFFSQPGIVLGPR
ncbi:MAG: dockerin type I domain-containing protein [Oscillospiraceae bacterium]|nr:dockerin type I domain-containing protein [Oscillospiraceae bacterium]